MPAANQDWGPRYGERKRHHQEAEARRRYYERWNGRMSAAVNVCREVKHVRGGVSGGGGRPITSVDARIKGEPRRSLYDEIQSDARKKERFDREHPTY